jgi:hypothetical protein
MRCCSWAASWLSSGSVTIGNFLPLDYTVKKKRPNPGNPSRFVESHIWRKVRAQIWGTRDLWKGKIENTLRFFLNVQQISGCPTSPDFLLGLVGPRHFMRLSCKESRTRDAGWGCVQEIRASRSFFARCGIPRSSISNPLVHLSVRSVRFRCVLLFRVFDLQQQLLGRAIARRSL